VPRARGFIAGADSLDAAGHSFETDVKETENDTTGLPDRPISPHRNFVTEADLPTVRPLWACDRSLARNPPLGARRASEESSKAQMTVHFLVGPQGRLDAFRQHISV
jgi:hypothetical protein